MPPRCGIFRPGARGRSARANGHFQTEPRGLFGLYRGSDFFSRRASRRHRSAGRQGETIMENPCAVVGTDELGNPKVYLQGEIDFRLSRVVVNAVEYAAHRPGPIIVLDLHAL